MNKEMDTRTPRDRVSWDFLRQLEAQENARRAADDVTYPEREVRHTAPTMAETTDRGHGKEENFPRRRHLAMVYSPEQTFGDLYETDEALLHGTIFRELDFPFYPTKCKENGGTCR